MKQRNDNKKNGVFMPFFIVSVEAWRKPKRERKSRLRRLLGQNLFQF